MIAGIGPGIGVCHYEVKEDIVEIFRAKFPLEVMAKMTQGDRLDLEGIAKYQLVATGLETENIEIDPDCTYCLPDRYFSFRRDKPESIEAMIAVIGLGKD